MDKVNGKLTVYFEEPFWVGVFERIKDGKLSVAKVTFGAEPKNYEVLEYVQKHYAGLKFSLAVDTVVKDIERNPKSIFYFQIKALIADFLHPLVIKGLVLPFQFDCIIIVINPYQRDENSLSLRVQIKLFILLQKT